MLKPEKAEKELEKVQSESHFDNRLARVKRLPKATKEIGCLLLGRDANGRVFTNWQLRNKPSVADHSNRYAARECPSCCK